MVVKPKHVGAILKDGC